VNERPAPDGYAANERIETLAETMAELLVAIENLHQDLAAIREAQERSAEVMRLHGGQLDALTAAIERLGGVISHEHDPP
jgi:predicted ATP-grasp superfamily ATP-dependent carboligase